MKDMLCHYDCLVLSVYICETNKELDSKCYEYNSDSPHRQGEQYLHSSDKGMITAD
jgi:hypothetical protein